MNKFYNQPVLLLWIESILLIIVGFWPALIVADAAKSQPIFYLIFFIYLPIFQCCSTPFFKLTGVYKYYSPMLLGYMANKKQIDLHSGTGFDYLFVMRKFKIGSESRNAILRYHLKGLLNIIKLIENDKIPTTVKIIGTSYFFNERTVNKFGFKVEAPSIFYRVNILVNFIDLVWMYSISKGRFSIPNILNPKKITIIGSELVDKKALILFLYTKMGTKTNQANNFDIGMQFK